MFLFLELLFINSVLAGLASIGFSILFNVPPKSLIYCFIAASVGFCVRSFVVHRGMGLEFASLLAAASVGLCAEVFSRFSNHPPILYSVSALIPMVPGALIFKTVLSMIQLTKLRPEELSDFLAATAGLGIKSTLIIGGLAAGVSLPSLIFFRKRLEV